MAGAYNLTLNLQFQAVGMPQLAAQLNKSLSNVQARIDVQINPASLRNIERLNAGLVALRSNIASLSGTAAPLAGGLLSVGTASDVAAKNLASVTSNMAAVANGSKSVASATQGAANQFAVLGSQAGLAARRFVAYTIAAGSLVAFVQGIKNGVKEAISFQDQMIKLGQISTETKGELAGIGEEVTRVATQFGVSSKDLIASALTLKQAGLSVDEVKKSIEALGKSTLAPSFGDLKKTTEASIAAMRQFGIESEKLNDTLGSINAVAAGFAVEAEDLGEAIKRSGGAFKVAGGDLNEFLALFTSVRSTTRESAETIATGLRTIFSRVQRQDVVDSLRQLNIELRYTQGEAKNLGQADLEGQFVGAYEAVRRLSEGLKDLRPSDSRYSQVVEELGGQRQISKVIPLIQQFSESQKALNVARTGGVSLDIAAAKGQESLIVRTRKVGEEFAKLFRTFTSSSSFKNIVSTFLDLATGLGKVLEYAKPLLPLLTAFATIKLVQGITSFVPNLFGSFASKPGTPIRRARGGPVPGVGEGDSVPAYLEPGEYVIRKQAAKQIGYDKLHEMNEGRRGYASGGPIEPDHFRRLAKQFKSKLTSKETQAFIAYTGSGEKVNDSLFAGKDKHLTSTFNGTRLELVRLLKKGINKAPSLGYDTEVYRGTDFTKFGDKELSKLLVGQRFASPGFSSTSINQGTAADLGSKLLNIRLPAGTPIAALGGLLGNPLESEVLLPPGTFGIRGGKPKIGSDIFGKKAFNLDFLGRGYASGGRVRALKVAEKLGITPENRASSTSDVQDPNILNAIGAIPGSSVRRVAKNFYDTEGPGDSFHSTRHLLKDGVIKNNSFSSSEQGQGLATESYARQLLFGGAKKIQIDQAMGGSGYSGYYVWPVKFGADGPLSRPTVSHLLSRGIGGLSDPITEISQDGLSNLGSLIKNQGGALNIQQLLSVKGGEAYWKRHGSSLEVSLSTEAELPYVRLADRLESLARKRGIKLAGGGSITAAKRQQLLESIRRHYADNPQADVLLNLKGLTKSQHALRLARTTLHGEALSELPEGSQFIGSGLAGLAFRDPNGEVIRLESTRAKKLASLARTDLNDKKLTSLFGNERPNIEGVLQAISSKVVASGKSGSTLVERLPYAPDITGLPKAAQKVIIRELKKKLEAQGYKFGDSHAGNVGRIGNEYAVIDPGSVKTDNAELFSIVQNAEKLANSQLPKTASFHGTVLKRAAGGPIAIKDYLKENTLAAENGLTQIFGIGTPLSKIVRGVAYNQSNWLPTQLEHITNLDKYSSKGLLSLSGGNNPSHEQLLNSLVKGSGESLFNFVFAKGNDNKPIAGFRKDLNSLLKQFSKLENFSLRGNIEWNSGDKRRIAFGNLFGSFLTNFSSNKSFGENSLFHYYQTPKNTTGVIAPLLDYVGENLPERLANRRVIDPALPYAKDLRKLIFQEGKFSTQQVPVVRRAEGGLAPEDKVPALLTPGEFILRKEAASRLGAAALHRMNVTGDASHIRGYNKGGFVRLSGGTNDGPIGSGTPDQGADKLTNSLNKMATAVDGVTKTLSPLAQKMALAQKAIQQKDAAKASQVTGPQVVTSDPSIVGSEVHKQLERLSRATPAKTASANFLQDTGSDEDVRAATLKAQQQEELASKAAKQGGKTKFDKALENLTPAQKRVIIDPATGQYTERASEALRLADEKYAGGTRARKFDFEGAKQKGLIRAAAEYKEGDDFNTLFSKRVGGSLREEERNAVRRKVVSLDAQNKNGQSRGETVADRKNIDPAAKVEQNAQLAQAAARDEAYNRKFLEFKKQNPQGDEYNFAQQEASRLKKLGLYSGKVNLPKQDLTAAVQESLYQESITPYHATVEQGKQKRQKKAAVSADTATAVEDAAAAPTGKRERSRGGDLPASFTNAMTSLVAAMKELTAEIRGSKNAGGGKGPPRSPRIASSGDYDDSRPERRPVGTAPIAVSLATLPAVAKTRGLDLDSFNELVKNVREAAARAGKMARLMSGAENVLIEFTNGVGSVKGFAKSATGKADDARNASLQARIGEQSARNKEFEDAKIRAETAKTIGRTSGIISNREGAFRSATSGEEQVNLSRSGKFTAIPNGTSGGFFDPKAKGDRKFTASVSELQNGYQAELDKIVGQGPKLSAISSIIPALTQIGPAFKQTLGEFATGVKGFAQRVNESKFGKAASGLQGLSLPLLIGLPKVAEEFDKAAGTSQDAVVGGTQYEARYSRNKAVGNAVQNSVIYSVVGNAIAGPAGAIFGAAAGAVSGFISGLREAELALRNSRIESALKTFGDRLTILANTSGTKIQSDPSILNGAIDSLETFLKENDAKSRESAKTRFLGGQISYNFGSFGEFRRAGIRNELGNQLPLITQNIQTQIDRLVRSNPKSSNDETFLELKNGGRQGKLNTELIDLISQIRNLPVATVEKEFRQGIEKSRKSFSDEQTTRRQDATITTYGKLLLSVQAASDSLIALQTKSALLSDTFDGVVNSSKVNANTSSLSQLGRGDNAALTSLGIVKNFGGEAGANLYESGAVADKIASALPSLLSIVASKGNTNEDEFSITLTGLLRKQFGNEGPTSDIIAQIQKSINEATREKGLLGISSELAVDATGFSDKLLSAYTEPLKKYAAETAKAIETQANSYIDGLIRFRSLLNSVGENLDKLSQSDLATTRLKTEIEARQAGRGRDYLDDISLTTLEKPDQQRLERLSSLQGAAAADPKILSKLLADTNKQLEGAAKKQQEAFLSPGVNAFNDASKSLVDLQSRSANLQQALKQLADVAQRSGAAQEKLNRLNEEKSSRLSVGERFLSSDAEGRQQISLGLIKANAANNKGNLDGLLPADQAQIIRVLREFGNARLTGFKGSPTASSLVEKLISNTYGNIFQPDQQGKTEQKNLEEVLLKNAEVGQSAQLALIKEQQTLASSFILNLDKSQGAFLKNLESLLIKDKLISKEGKLLQLTNEQAKLQKLESGRVTLSKFGITEDSQIKGLSGTGVVDKALDSVVDLKELYKNAASSSKKIVDTLSKTGTSETGKIPGQNQLLGAALNVTDISGVLSKEHSFTDEEIRGIYKKFQGEAFEKAKELGVEYKNPKQISSDVSKFPEFQQFLESSLNKIIEDAILNSKKGLKTKSGAVKAQDDLKKIGGLDIDITKDGSVENLKNIKSALDGFAKQSLEGFSKELKDTTESIKILKETILELRKGIAPPPNLPLPADGPPVKKFATGGIVGLHPGSPSGTDTIPAWLSSGEMVVRASSATKHRGLLEAINNSQGRPINLSRGGAVYLADGGPLDINRLILEDKLKNIPRQDADFLRDDKLFGQAQGLEGLLNKGPAGPQGGGVDLNPLLKQGPAAPQGEGINLNPFINANRKKPDFAKLEAAAAELRKKQEEKDNPVFNPDKQPDLQKLAAGLEELKRNQAAKENPGFGLVGLKDANDPFLKINAPEKAVANPEDKVFTKKEKDTNDELRRLAGRDPAGLAGQQFARGQLNKQFGEVITEKILFQVGRQNKLANLRRRQLLAQSAVGAFNSFGLASRIDSDQQGIAASGIATNEAFRSRFQKNDFLQQQVKFREDTAKRRRPNFPFEKNDIGLHKDNGFKQDDGFIRDRLGNIIGKAIPGVPVKQFAQGGIVGHYAAGGSIDDTPALLTKGEYVLRRQAVNNIGVNTLDQMNTGVQKFALGGLVGGSQRGINSDGSGGNSNLGLQPEVVRALTAFSGSTETLSKTLNAFGTNMTTLISAFGTFNQNVATLAKSLESFPKTLAVNVTGTQQVIINGAEAIAKMEPAMKGLIEKTVNEKLNSVFKNTFPDVNFNAD